MHTITLPLQSKILSSKLTPKMVAHQVNDTTKRGRGRPKGSKNKTTDEDVDFNAAAALNVVSDSESPKKRGRGRPKGSKNKKTPTSLALAHKRPTKEEETKVVDSSNTSSDDNSEEFSEKAVKKPSRGRPKGSKNKKTPIFDRHWGIKPPTPTSLALAHKRPTKEEKATTEESSSESSDEEGPKKRGRGRPKGSKNKNTPIFDRHWGIKPPTPTSLALAHKRPTKEESSSESSKSSDEEAPKKRGRGRPKGTKNKIKRGTMKFGFPSFEGKHTIYTDEMLETM